MRQSASGQEGDHAQQGADDTKNARLIVSTTVLEALKSLKMKYPETSDQRRRELESIHKKL